MVYQDMLADTRSDDLFAYRWMSKPKSEHYDWIDLEQPFYGTGLDSKEEFLAWLPEGK
jgi:hypothetical protein